MLDLTIDILAASTAVMFMGCIVFMAYEVWRAWR